METDRETLRSLIRRVLTNGTTSALELVAAVPDPSALNAVEKAAWIALYFWDEDSPARAADRHWEQTSVARLEHLLSRVQVRFSDRQSWHPVTNVSHS